MFATVAWPAEPPHLAQDLTPGSGGWEAGVPQEQTLHSAQAEEMRAWQSLSPDLRAHVLL